MRYLEIFKSASEGYNNLIINDKFEIQLQSFKLPLSIEYVKFFPFKILYKWWVG